MSSNIVIITSKLLVSQRLLSVVVEFYPESIISFIHTGTLGFFDFKYPKNLKIRDFPIIRNPELKLRKMDKNIGNAYHIEDGALVVSTRTIQDVLNAADDIIYAADPDRLGVYTFQTLLSQTCSDAVINKVKKAVVLTDFSERSVRAGFQRNGVTTDDWFVQFYSEAQVNKYFDYNFNINSAVIFGEALSSVGVDSSNFVLGKNGLVLLYFLRKVGSITTAEMLSLMNNNWTGTGKYPKGSLGTVSSRIEQIDRYIKIELIHRDGENLRLSNKGEMLLLKLHPDCCDLDLPLRLELWLKEGSNSMPKINRYLRTLFGKQMRFTR